MQNGYIKLWRKLEHSPIFTNSEAVHLFVYLLIKANRIEREKIHGNTKIKLLPGQLITGRKALAEATGINESKVYRTLELLKSEQQIEQQTNSKYSIITICNWQSYQQSEQQIEQPVNNKRTASEQQVNTDNKEEKLKTVENEKKEPKSSRFTPPTIEEARGYFFHLNAFDESEGFYHYHESKGWKVGSSKMANWKSAVVTWIKKDYNGNQARHKMTLNNPKVVDINDLDRMRGDGITQREHLRLEEEKKKNAATV